ncbi:MAG: Flp pilus assembly protein CpaB [Proteobacteria bacterium]|nr:MAG: Flp pilus assembly protein CpaB [Pseudomonadota bacterium]
MLKGKTPLLIALILALLAGALAWYQIKMYKEEVTRGWQLQDVIVASSNLQPGNFLSNDSVSVDKMPRKFIYESVLVPADMEVALGREVVVPIKRGEPIHWYQLQGIRSLERLSKAVRNHGRAISMDVTERSSVGQWVRPNDHVDVLGTFRDANSNQMVAVTLLQNVIVLATGQTTSASQTRRARQYGTVTLLVLPEEAEIMVLAQELGTLYLSLRNAEDISIFEERARTTIETLLTGERVKKLQQRRYRTIQIIRGITKKLKR